MDGEQDAVYDDLGQNGPSSRANGVLEFLAVRENTLYGVTMTPEGEAVGFPCPAGGASAPGTEDTVTVADTCQLDAFPGRAGGRPVSSTGSTVNPYRYGGAWGYITDPSGMLQLGARFYWPEVGRFVQRDPAGHGVNWYAYVANNPVAEADPSGYGFIGQLRCMYCTGVVLKWRHHCVTEHADLCETWETDDQMGDRVARINACINQHTRPGYVLWCLKMCASSV